MKNNSICLMKRTKSSMFLRDTLLQHSLEYRDIPFHSPKRHESIRCDPSNVTM